MKKIVLFFPISLTLLSLFFPVSIRAFVDVECDADGNAGVNTAIGCIAYEEGSSLVTFILKWAMGLAGGIALLLIIVAGFQIITSAGDPKRLQAGQELLTSAIGGLLLVVFSVILLRLIGVDLLGIL